MKLDTEFIRLPLRFDVNRLAEEVVVFGGHEWRDHPTGYDGNSALILISRNGEQNDQFIGPMKPTPALDRCPYIKQVLASFQTVYGRSRLMRLAPYNEVPLHADINYHWKHRVRIHVPIITDPGIQFICGKKSVHMAAGEAWIFDAWKQHTVINSTEVTRVHLVADTAGTPEFWNMVERSERPFGDTKQEHLEERFVPFDPDQSLSLITEQFTHPVIMSPGEVDALVFDLLSESVSGNEQEVEAFRRIVHEFRRYWRCIWAAYGPTEQGAKQLRAIIENTRMKLKNTPTLFLQSNGTDAVNVFTSWVLNAALTVDKYSNKPAATRVASR